MTKFSPLSSWPSSEVRCKIPNHRVTSTSRQPLIQIKVLLPETLHQSPSTNPNIIASPCYQDTPWFPWCTFLAVTSNRPGLFTPRYVSSDLWLEAPTVPTWSGTWGDTLPGLFRYVCPAFLSLLLYKGGTETQTGAVALPRATQLVVQSQGGKPGHVPKLFS